MAFLKGVFEPMLFVKSCARLLKSGRIFYAWRVWAGVMFCVLFSAFSATQAAELGKIRIGQTADKTRVVFEIKKNHRFEVHELAHPQRVVLDFYRTKSQLLFKKKTFQDVRLAAIRVKNQPAKDRVRIVLDLRQASFYRYFTLGKNARGYERVVVDLLPPKKGRQVASKQKTKVPKRVAKSKSSSHRPKSVRVAKLHPSKHPQKPFMQLAGTQDLLQMLTAAPVQHHKQVVIAIDPGHGGKDTGAIGASGTYEKDVTLALAKQLKRYIDAQPNMRAVLTRDRDVFIPLYRRVKIAHQKKADIFVSLHADAYISEEARGGSVYVLSTKGASSVMARLLAKSENASLKGLSLNSKKDKDVAFALSDMAREANIRASRQLAKKVLFEMQKTVRVHKHTVQSADFAVLKSIDMPSLLIETAFISNPREERNLKSRHFQVKMAKSIARGLRQFVKRKGTKPVWGETLFVHYKVNRGDTLSQIAENYKISTRKLMRINHLKNANQLYVGRRLKIPLSSQFLAGL